MLKLSDIIDSIAYGEQMTIVFRDNNLRITNTIDLDFQAPAVEVANATRNIDMFIATEDSKYYVDSIQAISKGKIGIILQQKEE